MNATGMLTQGTQQAQISNAIYLPVEERSVSHSPLQLSLTPLEAAYVKLIQPTIDKVTQLNTPFCLLLASPGWEEYLVEVAERCLPSISLEETDQIKLIEIVNALWQKTKDFVDYCFLEAHAPAEVVETQKKLYSQCTETEKSPLYSGVCGRAFTMAQVDVLAQYNKIS